MKENKVTTAERSPVKTGMSFEDILSSAGVDPSSAESVEAYARGRGYDERTIRMVKKGALQYAKNKSGRSFHFTEKGDGFRIYDGEDKEVTKSGRGSGNRRGFNLGDLVGIGDNVSAFAGLVQDAHLEKKTSSPVQNGPTKTNVRAEQGSGKTVDKTGSSNVEGFKDTSLVSRRKTPVRAEGPIRPLVETEQVDNSLSSKVSEEPNEDTPITNAIREKQRRLSEESTSTNNEVVDTGIDSKPTTLGEGVSLRQAQFKNFFKGLISDPNNEFSKGIELSEAMNKEILPINKKNQLRNSRIKK